MMNKTHRRHRFSSQQKPTHTRPEATRVFLSSRSGKFHTVAGMYQKTWISCIRALFNDNSLTIYSPHVVNLTLVDLPGIPLNTVKNITHHVNSFRSTTLAFHWLSNSSSPLYDWQQASQKSPLATSPRTSKFKSEKWSTRRFLVPSHHFHRRYFKETPMLKHFIFMAFNHIPPPTHTPKKKTDHGIYQEPQ